MAFFRFSFRYLAKKFTSYHMLCISKTDCNFLAHFQEFVTWYMVLQFTADIGNQSVCYLIICVIFDLH